MILFQINYVLLKLFRNEPLIEKEITLKKVGNIKEARKRDV